MARALFVLVLVGLLPAGSAEAKSDKEEIVTVTVKGLGIDKKSALDDALRKAVEQGGKIKLYAVSKTENYVLVKDTILAQASGLVKKYDILKEGQDPLGGYYVRIRAQVDRKIIDATWGQVELLLKQLGRPKILVSFVERIYDDTLPVGHKERIDADSLLANSIEKLLLEKGFELVDKTQIGAIKQAKLKQALLAEKPDLATIRRLAGEFGAQMFIVGHSRASGPQITDTYGVKLYMWETDITLKAYWSATAAMLFADNKVGVRSGSRVSGPPGAKKAIAKTGDIMARKCLQAILQKWSQMAVGGGKVILEVKDLTFTQMLKIKKALEKIKGVKEVHRKWRKPRAEFEIITTDGAEAFSEKLIELEWPKFALEIEEQKFNTISASVKAKE